METNALSEATGSYDDRDAGALVRLNAMSWQYDVFGRVIDHNNLSGRDSDYIYDAQSGMLTGESASGGTNAGYADAIKTIKYTRNGRVREIVETNGGTYRYEYDAAGNRTLEESIVTDGAGKAVQTITRTTYDSNNRVQRVVQDDVIGAKRVFDLLYDYDANGNRRRVVTQSGYGANVDGIAVVNTAPAAVVTPADRGLRKGATSEFRLLFSDVFRDAEGDALTLSITQGSGAALPGWLVATRDPQTGEIVFTATVPAGMADTDVLVKLTAFETANPGNTVYTTFTVKVRSNNAPTVVGGNISVNAKLNEVLQRDLSAGDHFADIDVGDALALGIVGNVPSWLTVNTSAPGLVRLSGTPTVAGNVTLTLRATDAAGAFVDKTITIVSAANLAPTVVAAVPPQDATINRSFAWTTTLPQVFTDGNGDALQVTASGLPSWLSFQHIATQVPAQLRISGQVPATAVDGQIYNVVLTATDTSGASVNTTVQVRVTTNIPPQAAEVANKTGYQGLAYSAVLPEFLDENGDTLTYSLTGLPPGLSFNTTTRTLNGTPTTAGSWTLTYSANDGRVNTSTTFTMTVVANTAPMAPTVGAQTGTRNTPAYLTLPAFTDANGDTLSYSASNLPPGLSFNASTQAISGTPTSSGSWTVTYTANDGRGGVASTTFVYTISEPAGNQAPVVANPLVDQYADGGVAFSYQFAANTFFDPENLGLTYSYAILVSGGLSGWLSFNASTRTFSGTPGAFLDGTWTIRVTATDNIGQQVYDDFNLTVTPSGGGQFMAPPTESTLSFEMGLSEEVLIQGLAAQQSAPSGPLSVQVKDEWYTYDALNRIRISGGALSGAAGAQGTTIQLVPWSSTVGIDAYEQGYDAVGRLVLTYRQRTLNGQTVTVADRTSYDLRGQRTYEFHQQILGFSGDPGVAKAFTYDVAGQLVETRSYYQNGWEMNTPVSIEGVLQTRDVSGWLSAAEQLSYDGDGRVRWQLSLARLGTTVPYYESPANLALEYTDLGKLGFQSRVDYTLADATPNNHDDNPSGYDSAGRLYRYRYSAVSPDNVNYTHTFTSAYEGWEGWMEKTVAGETSESTYKPTTNTLSYDVFGRLIKQQEHTENQNGAIDDRMRVYSNTAEGQVQSRRDGTWKQVNSVWQFVEGEADPNTGATPNYGFVYSGGTQVAELVSGSRARANMPTHSILGVNGSGSYVAGGGTVAALQGEDLRELAQRVYGTSSLWYVLADANGLSNPDKNLTAGVQLKAPSMGVSSNDANTFRPYNPNEAIGSTSPSLPYIPKPQGCDTFLMVMIAVVAIAVAVATWGGLAGLAGEGTLATGSAVVVAAAAGAAGAATSGALQSFTNTGTFSWRNVAAGAITGAITGGAGAAASATSSVAAQAGSLLLSGSASYIGNKIAGVQNTHFSWKSIAANAVASAVTSSASNAISGRIANNALRGFIGGAVGGATSAGLRKLMGADEEFDYMSVIQGAINGMMTSRAFASEEDGESNIKSSVAGKTDLSKSSLDLSRVMATEFGRGSGNGAVYDDGTSPSAMRIGDFAFDGDVLLPNGNRVTREEAMKYVRKQGGSAEEIARMAKAFENIDRLSSELNVLADRPKSNDIRSSRTLRQVAPLSASNKARGAGRSQISRASLDPVEPMGFDYKAAEMAFELPQLILDTGLLLAKDAMSSLRESSKGSIYGASNGFEAGIASGVYAINSVTDAVVSGAIDTMRLATNAGVRRDFVSGMGTLLTTRPDYTAKAAWNTWSNLPLEDQLRHSGAFIAGFGTTAIRAGAISDAARAAKVGARAESTFRVVPDPVANGGRPLDNAANSKVVATSSEIADPGKAKLIPRSALTGRQKRLVDLLHKQGEFAFVPRRAATMKDLLMLTRHTGDEFSMYTIGAVGGVGAQRLIIRGYGRVTIVPTEEMAANLRAGMYGKWSGHTHPPGYRVTTSPDDAENLRFFTDSIGQRRSAIWGDNTKKPHLFAPSGNPLDDLTLEQEATRLEWYKRFGVSGE